jgi:hypothetical protein
VQVTGIPSLRPITRWLLRANPADQRKWRGTVIFADYYRLAKPTEEDKAKALNLLPVDR